VRPTTSPPSRAECHEIWEPKPPGTIWATPGLLGTPFPLPLYIYIYMRTDNKVRELIAVKVLYTSLLNTIVFALKILLLGKLCTDASA